MEGMNIAAIGKEVRIGLPRLTDVRADFPILRQVNGRGLPLVYLDNAATTQKPVAVLEKERWFYEHASANVHRSVHTLSAIATASYEEARIKVQKFINARKSSEIVFTHGCTEAINLIARSFALERLRAKDSILLTDLEHHSNLVPWQMIASKMDLELKFLPCDAHGELRVDDLDNYWSDRIKLVSITGMSNVFGTMPNLQSIIRFAHAHGVPVVVDGAQLVAHQRVDVQQLECDFFTFSGHKLYGPMGIGILYGRERWLEEMPPFLGGGEMIGEVWPERATWNELPYKFEAGTPNVSGAIGLGAAIDYLGALGMEEIERYERNLGSACFAALESVPNIELYGEAKHRSSIIPFNLQGIHCHDVAQFLDRDGIAIRAGHHCAQPLLRKLGIDSSARVSLAFYNTVEELETLVHALKSTGEFFGHGV